MLATEVVLTSKVDHDVLIGGGSLSQSNTSDGIAPICSRPSTIRE